MSNGNVQACSVGGYYRLGRDTHNRIAGPLNDGISVSLQGRQSDKYMDMPSRVVNL